MFNLAKNLPLIIGHSLDKNESCWQILLTMKQILEIVCSTKITQGTCQYLEVKINEYLTALTEKFPKSMNPKHHFLLHYPSIMRKIGTLWNISYLRFESKNREGK